MIKDDYYRVLRLPITSTLPEVKQAYRSLAKVWHPDRFSYSMRFQNKAEERMKLINEAYVQLQAIIPQQSKQRVQSEGTATTAVPRTIMPFQVIGIGSSGTSILNGIMHSKLEDVELVAMNTDEQVSDLTQAEHKLQMGRKIVGGHGASGDPNVGKLCAENAADQIEEIVENAFQVILVAGFGGGTGTGAAPVIAKIARRVGAEVAAFVVTPFKFEGPKRKLIADEGLAELLPHVDALYSFSNNTLLSLVVEPDMSIEKAFTQANNVACLCIKKIIGVTGSGGSEARNITLTSATHGRDAADKHFVCHFT